MTGIIGILNELYIRFMVWLGAAPPPGYEHLIRDETVAQKYTVKSGDTLFAVARKFGVHYNRIAQANALQETDSLHPGQTLIIPPAGWDPASGPLARPEPAPQPAKAPEPAPPPAPTPEPELRAKPEPPPPEPQPEPPPPEPAPTPEPELRAKPEPPPPEPQPEPPPPEPVPAPEPEPEPDWLAEEFAPSPEEEEEELPDWLAEELIEEEEESAAEPGWLAEEPEPEAEPDWLAEEPEVQPPAAPEPEVSRPPDQMAFAVEPPVVAAEPEAPPATPAPPKAAAPETPPVEKVPAKKAGERFRYTVQRGDTLNAIARKYGVTVKDLIEANNIINPSLIFPGQKLVIPGYLAPEPPPPEEPLPSPPRPTGQAVMHPVSRGDTLSSIAKRYGITVRELVEANNIQDPSRIRVGQHLLIPGVAAAPPKVKPAPPPPQVAPVPAPAVAADPAFPPLGPPDAVRGLYVSYFAIGHADSRRHIFDLLDRTEINTVVIDAKGDHGLISYPTQVAPAREVGAAHPTAKDFDTVMSQLKARRVYTIARIVTFKDDLLAKNYPEYAVKTTGPHTEIWHDNEQSGWVDPFLEAVWDYNIQIAIEAAHLNFDEIQFDYVRFPTAGQAGEPQFSQEATPETRMAATTGFLSAAKGQLEPFGVKVSAKLFGYTCWRKDDMLIGQNIERMGQYLDVISPMLCPSTFGSGIPGYKMAVAHPYEVVYQSARRAVERLSGLNCTVRPWIQDFPDYKFDRRVYNRNEIQAQIKGCFDAGCNGFLVWDPHVTYTSAAYAPVKPAP